MSTVSPATSADTGVELRATMESARTVKGMLKTRVFWSGAHLRPLGRYASKSFRDIVLVNNPGTHDSEFGLMVASALWPRRPGDRERVRQLARQELDWPVFVEMVLLHHLGPIVF